MASLTAAELEEIQEYRKIVEFARQAMAGTHPRVKIPPHLLHHTTTRAVTLPTNPPNNRSISLPTALVPPAARSMPNLEPGIDYNHNYYKDLGVQSHVPVDSIIRGFNSKRDLFSPASQQSKRNWQSTNSKIRRRARNNWERVEKARKILTNPVLRAKYDKGRGKQDLNVQK